MKSSRQYPAPRQPDYINYERPPTSVEELLPAAREAVKRSAGPGALGKAEAGDHALLVVPVGQDQLVLDAILEAFREKGIEATAKYDYEIGMSRPPEELTKTSIADGWTEVLTKEPVAELLHPRLASYRPRNVGNDRGPLRDYLEKHPEITAVWVGGGGQTQTFQQLREHGPKFKEAWIYTGYEELFSRFSQFPSEVWRAIEGKIVGVISEIELVRIEDPQGTHIEYSITQEEAKLWAEAVDSPGMLVTYPLSASRTRVQKGIIPAEEEVLVFPKANGVIAGTANHAGYFPHMICHVEDGVVTRIEGGGALGDLLRELTRKTKDIQWPRHPRPGYNYINEGSLGTNPKVVRRRQGVFDTFKHYPNSDQRHRAGHLKWGIGVHTHHPEAKAFAKETGLPIEHGWHVYNAFPTFEVRLRSGEWVQLVNRGHLVALDDPDVRQLASGYGDPDEILREDWFPAIPGINYPGDYTQEYGRDPAAWVRKENEGRLPEVIGVPQPS